MRSNWFRKSIFIIIGLLVVIAALITRRQPVVWLFFLDECGWYLVVAIFIQAPVFVAGSFVFALLPRQHPGALGWRLLRFGLFVWLFLFVSSFFNGLWSCLVWNHLYYSADYMVDFFPFWPITQNVIDSTFGDDHGILMGVTLRQLQLVWLLFALGAWIVTFFLYRVLNRFLARTPRRMILAVRFMIGVLFLSSLFLITVVWKADVLNCAALTGIAVAALLAPAILSFRLLRTEKEMTHYPRLDLEPISK